MIKRIFLVVIFLLSIKTIEAEEKIIDRVAFGSCSHQMMPQPIWKAIGKQNPDLFVHLGDTVYADTRDMKAMKSIYDRFAAIPEFRTFRRQVPIIAIWDDHDYGMNDAGSEYPQKMEAGRIFLDFFKVPQNDPRRSGPGLYGTYRIGPPGKRIQIILLDTRYFRSPLKRSINPLKGPYTANTDKGATILGPTQWRWLEAKLRDPADIRIIASSIQVIADNHAYEKWMNFPDEHQRLFHLLKKTGASNTFFISGDRHFAEISHYENAGIDYYDITSSGLNQKWPDGAKTINPRRVGNAYGESNFGLLDIDWSGDRPKVNVTIRDINGMVKIKNSIPIGLPR